MTLEFFSYRIPFKNHFKTAKSDFKFREGSLIRLQKNGITAWGEAAPLPGFSTKTLDQVKQQIRDNRSLISNYFTTDFTLSDTQQLLGRFQSFPALQFGLFTATVNYLAQVKQQSVHQFLFPQADEKIRINAVVDLNEKNVLSTVEKKIKAGFETIKIKTGSNSKQSIQLIEQIRRTYKKLNIRLDANQSWSLDEAIAFLSKVEPYEIEYCEEPLKEPSVQNLLMLKGKVSTPLALDETMIYWPKIEDQALIADFLILKPMITGGQETIGELYDFAQKHHKKLIFTSSLGTAVERLMVASFAAGYGSTRHAHGLSTGQLLQNDLWNDDDFIDDGKFLLPLYQDFKQLIYNDYNNIKLNKI